MRQGLKENKSWMYETNKNWSSKEINEYQKVKKDIQSTFEDYLLRKRKEAVPFTEDNYY